jgi:Disulphide bond corrector protein DsbC
MKKSLLFICALFCAASTMAQSEPVQWQFSSKKLAGQKYEVKLTAAISHPWHIYSTTQGAGGPLPTKITFNKNPLLVIAGQVKEEGKLQTVYEEVFKIDTKFFNEKVSFAQVLSVRGKAKTKISGKVEFMVCNDKECLPPQEVSFTMPLQ